MKPNVKSVKRTYLTLTLFSTLAASFIWGVNTLFLLDAGLSNLEAFTANAFFTLGMVLFEVPTGVVADNWGRRQSYLLGTVTLIISTLLYLLMWQTGAPFIGWAISSIFLGLGFTFFSGAVEAWLVDCLKYVGYNKDLDSVFAQGQVVGGIAMLAGSVAGGVVAQFTNLGVPYLLRTIVLVAALAYAFYAMKDLGFKPSRTKDHIGDMKRIFVASIEHGWKKSSIRYVMISSVFMGGVGMYAFYAMQPYLLELYGDPSAYSVAGLAAAIVAGAQIVGGLLVPRIRKLFEKRTDAFITDVVLSVLVLSAIGFSSSFYLTVVLLVIWAMLFAAIMPIRQAYMNGLIESKHRATVLSFDAMIGSIGGVGAQPLLGKAADVWNYSTSYVIGAGIQLFAIPLFIAAKRTNPASDPMED